MERKIIDLAGAVVAAVLAVAAVIEQIKDMKSEELDIVT